MKKSIVSLMLTGLFSQCTTTVDSFQSIISSPQGNNIPTAYLGNSGQEHTDNTDLLNNSGL